MRLFISGETSSELDADYSPGEENERKGHFIKTHEMIEKHNSNPEATPKLAHNHLSALVCSF